MTAGVWIVGGTLLWWPLLPAAWRRALSLLASVTGVAFLLVAVNTEGLRESPTVSVFLVGTPYVTQQISALASLPYYFLTAFFLMLGTAGLAVGDRLAESLGRHVMANAIGLTLVVALMRFALEKAAAPQWLSELFGVTLLAPVAGAYLYLNRREDGLSFGRLVGSIATYALAVRVPVAAIYVLATSLRLGTHYDVTALVRVFDPFTHGAYEFVPGSARQILSLAVVPQLVVWPVYTVIAGLIGAGVAGILSSQWRPPAVPTRSAPPQPAPQAD